MRDTSKQLRIAVFNALNGVISVPVYDEKRLVSATATTYVLLSTQQETPTEENDCNWNVKSSIDLQIMQKTGSEVSKDDIDDIANEIVNVLLPTRSTIGITAPVNLQFTNPMIESIISRDLSLSETESILIKLVRFVVTIIQQT